MTAQHLDEWHNGNQDHFTDKDFDFRDQDSLNGGSILIY